MLHLALAVVKNVIKTNYDERLEEFQSRISIDGRTVNYISVWIT